MPGPVAGILLLFFLLRVRQRIPRGLDAATSGLLQPLSLPFVPPGVGIMLHLQRIAHAWLAIAAALVPSTLLAIAVTAAAMQLVTRHRRANTAESAERPGPG